MSTLHNRGRLPGYAKTVSLRVAKITGGKHAQNKYIAEFQPRGKHKYFAEYYLAEKHNPNFAELTFAENNSMRNTLTIKHSHKEKQRTEKPRKG